jgi:hypothetical protein
VSASSVFGEPAEAAVCYQYQPDRWHSITAAVLWGDASAWLRASRRPWTAAELQRDLRTRCGVWIDPAAAAVGRLAPVRLEVVALSVGGLMPNGCPRDIGCLHTTPVSSSVDLGRTAFSRDDGRRICCEVQLTSPGGGALSQAVVHRRVESAAAAVGEESGGERPRLKKRKKKSEPVDAPDAERHGPVHPEERATVRRKSAEAATVDRPNAGADLNSVRKYRVKKT